VALEKHAGRHLRSAGRIGRGDRPDPEAGEQQRSREGSDEAAERSRHGGSRRRVVDVRVLTAGD
jgi:hypothetical protein